PAWDEPPAGAPPWVGLAQPPAKGGRTSTVACALSVWVRPARRPSTRIEQRPSTFSTSGPPRAVSSLINSVTVPASLRTSVAPMISETAANYHTRTLLRSSIPQSTPHPLVPPVTGSVPPTRPTGH